MRAVTLASRPRLEVATSRVASDGMIPMVSLHNKPIALLAAAAPALAAADLVIALTRGLSWCAALGLFYCALAAAELIYLMVVFGGALSETGQGRQAPELAKRSDRTPF